MIDITYWICSIYFILFFSNINYLFREQLQIMEETKFLESESDLLHAMVLNDSEVIW